MSTLRPKLKDIVERIKADAEARLDEEELRRSDISVFIRVLAGVSHSIYAAIDYYKNQLFSDSAETAFLERRASIFNMARRRAAKAVGKVKFVYFNEIKDVSVGTLLQSQSGLQYQTIDSPNSEGISSVRAVLGGEEYNLPKDNALNLVNTISGVARAVVYEDIKGGTDAETDDELRERVLERTQKPPRQGTKEDYIAWSKEVEGVGNVWCFPREMGDGTVTIRFLTTDYKLPDDALISKVKRYIESKASILATIYVEAPLEQTVDFRLQITPSNQAVKDAAVSALKKLFRTESVPGGVIYLSHINAVLSSVANEDDHVIITPSSDIIAESNAYLPTVGEIIWEN